MYAPLLPAPDILSVWRRELLAALQVAGIDASVGPKRPAETQNLQGLFVRIMCLGGPWRYRNLWYPRLAAESWAPTVVEARALEGVVSLATRSMEGLREPPTPTNPGMFISSLELDLSGSDQSLDGVPFVLTTTNPLCVAVTPYRKDTQ